jgi:Mlc titration factor MtfA (ptsG expression regulator)
VGYWIFLALAIIAIILALLIPRYRLKKAIAAPFPDEWVEIVERNIAVYRNLPIPLRLQLRGLIKQFLHQKSFSGAGGLEITDEIRVTIAAEACMLLLNRNTNVYPSLRYIIVYPTAFIVDRQQVGMDGTVGEGPKGLLGESWANGKVILAWDNVLQGARNFVDGHNVVLHEFAHQLDSETGSTNGAPILAGSSGMRTWAKTLTDEFQDLQLDYRRGKRSLMDHYGATNPAEFFAVATETFFEKPEEMAKHHTELFEVLKAYYRIDPADWKRPPAAE